MRTPARHVTLTDAERGKAVGIQLVRGLTATILGAMLVAGCGRSYSLECGPLDRRPCEARATEIVSIVSREFAPGQVSSIVILDIAGHATVLLGDGTRLDVVGGQAREQMT